MTLVLLLLVLVIIICLICFIIVYSSIKIKIKKLEVQNISTTKIEYDFCIDICFSVFNKITFFVIKINKAKIKKSKVYEKIMDINKQKISSLDLIKSLKKISPKIKYLNLDLKLGVENAAITSTINTSLIILISILLPAITEYKDNKKIKYKICPLYNNKNELKLKLEGVICVKIVDIISITFTILQKNKHEKIKKKPIRGEFDNNYERL